MRGEMRKLRNLECCDTMECQFNNTQFFRTEMKLTFKNISYFEFHWEIIFRYLKNLFYLRAYHNDRGV
jgi:hypothetical protein